MKKYLGILILFCCIQSMAQTSIQCTTPIAHPVFQQGRRTVEIQVNDYQKLNAAVTFVSSNCLSSAQLRELMELFRIDNDRLQLARSAYPNLTDKINTYDLYDAFDYFSTAFRFYDFIRSQPQASSQPSGSCTTTTGEFSQVINSIRMQSLDQNKMEIARQVIKSKCLSSEQIKDIMQQLVFEQSKLEIARYAYDYVTDKPNYYLVNNVFKHSASVTALSEYLKTK